MIVRIKTGLEKTLKRISKLQLKRVCVCMNLIYLLTAIGLPPSGSCTVHIYTQTIHRMTQNKQYIEQHKNKQYIEQTKYGRVRAVPCLCELYPDICLKTEEKAWKSLSQGKNLSQGNYNSINHGLMKNVHDF
jgi:hypothetical protein